MQPRDSMIDPFTPAYGVLSQNSLQHLQDLLAAHPPAFNQAADHSHMLHHRRLPRNRLRLGAPRPGFTLPVLDALLELAGILAVILRTPLRGRSLAAGLLAAKRTTQILATSIARVSEKKDPAMPAPGQASSQEGLGSQDRSQQQIILQHHGGHRAPAIPVGPELEMLLDPYCKKPKLSLRMLIS
jgi:hypothetical protein